MLRDKVEMQESIENILAKIYVSMKTVLMLINATIEYNLNENIYFLCS